MKQILKKYGDIFIFFCVASFALVMFFLIIFARVAGEMGVPHETGQLVLYCGYIYITFAMLAPLVVADML